MADSTETIAPTTDVAVTTETKPRLTRKERQRRETVSTARSWLRETTAVLTYQLRALKAQAKIDGRVTREKNAEIASLKNCATYACISACVLRNYASKRGVRTMRVHGTCEKSLMRIVADTVFRHAPPEYVTTDSRDLAVIDEYRTMCGLAVESAIAAYMTTVEMLRGSLAEQADQIASLAAVDARGGVN